MAMNPNPPLVEPEYIERARKLGPALLADGMKALGDIKNDGVMEAAMLPVSPEMVMVGTALTVDTDNGDNYPIHLATYSGGEGYVMVIDGKGYQKRAYLGDLIVSAAAAVGYEGIVCDGCVRDRNGCIELGFPVFSKGFMQRGPIKKDPGSINTEVCCGGIAVTPGDLVVGDCDGVTVVPCARSPEVLEKAEEKARYEIERRATIQRYLECKRNGEPLFDLAPKWVRNMMK